MVELQRYHWPGNIRELRNLVERAVIMARTPHLTIEVPRTPAPREAPPSAALHDVLKSHIRATLERSHWRVRGRGGAAEQLGMKPSTLETRMAKLGLVRPRPTIAPVRDAAS